MLTHTYEPVSVPEQDKVDEFLPPYVNPYTMDLDNPKILLSALLLRTTWNSNHAAPAIVEARLLSGILISRMVTVRMIPWWPCSNHLVEDVTV